jgi:hypothetical protein
VRCALEVDDGSQARLEKIYSLIEQCRYGVHDICRTELDPDHGLPRFNMPLELGIFLAAKRFGGSAQKEKRCLILDTERYRYQKFMSDLAGSDIREHAGQPEQAIRQLRDWLANVSRRALPGHVAVVESWREFSGGLSTMVDQAGLEIDLLPYADYERLVIGWLTR